MDKSETKRAVTSIHFSDAKDLANVRKAAKLAGTTVSALVAEAAALAAARVIAKSTGKCPTCGVAPKKTKKAA